MDLVVLGTYLVLSIGCDEIMHVTLFKEKTMQKIFFKNCQFIL